MNTHEKRREMIRVATSEDVDDVANIQVLSWKAAYVNQVPDHVLERLEVDSKKKSWRTILADPDQRTFVSEINNQLVGFSNVAKSRDKDLSPNYGEIRAIYILKNYWSKGIGKLLLEKSLNYLASNGFDRSSLWVLQTNGKAIEFYEKYGFQRDGEVKVESRPGYRLSEIRMIRECN
jgi:ribosomal protein S18 acetylase RimI-like enzyme